MMDGERSSGSDLDRTIVRRGGRGRRWSAEEKARVVRESFRSGRRRGCQGSPKSPHFQGRTPCVESITATICRACLGQSSLTVDQLQVGQIGKMPQDLVVAGSHLTPNSPGRQCAAKLATDGSGAAPAASDPRPVSSIGLRFAAIRTDRRPRLRDREPGARPSLGGDQMLRSRRL